MQSSHSLTGTLNQAAAMALVTHTNVRLMSSYRTIGVKAADNARKTGVSKTERGLKTIADRHVVSQIRTDLVTADKIMDQKVNEFSAKVASTHGAGSVDLNFDWPKLVQHPSARGAEFSGLNLEDPVVEEILTFVKTELLTIDQLAGKMRNSYAAKGRRVSGKK